MSRFAGPKLAISQSPDERDFDISTSIQLALHNTPERLLFPVIFGALSLFFLPWRLIAVWLVCVFAWELVLRPPLNRVVLKLRYGPAIQLYALGNFLGASVNALIALAGLASGSPVGVALAVTWLMGSWIVCFAYFSANRLLILGCVAPGVIAAAVGSVLCLGVHLEALAVTLLSVVGLMATRRFSVDRRWLATALADKVAAVSDLEGKLALALEASGDGLFEIDVITGQANVSPTWVTMLGYEPGEIAVPVAELLDFVHPDDVAGILEIQAAHFRGETDHAAAEYRMRCKNGDYKWVLVRGRLVERTADGRPWRLVGTTMDLTAQKVLEHQLGASRDQAESANHAKGVFLANMSHEIRTPLNGVIGVTGALARTPLSDIQREMVELIQSSGQTLERLVSDILDQAKIDAGDFQLQTAPFDLRHEIETAAELMRARADEKGVAFSVSYADAAQGLFEGDGVRIRQIVTNLASNAIKFTEYGAVRLSVAADDAVSRDAPSLITIEVTDTGVGFDSESAKRLFTRFSQADDSISRRFGGTGLGLAICKTLVELMGGEISARSEPGVGSTFTVKIPLPRAVTLAAYHDRADMAEAPAIDAQDASFDRLRILMAEDHPTNQRVVQMILQPLGIDLTVVDNGEQAVELYRSDRFDLILMDMQMPVMDGLAATRAIRCLEAERGGARTPIAMLTANAMEEHRLAATQAGADHLIAKPITPQSLLAGIEATLREGLAPPDAAARLAV